MRFFRHIGLFLTVLPLLHGNTILFAAPGSAPVVESDDATSAVLLEEITALYHPMEIVPETDSPPSAENVNSPTATQEKNAVLVQVHPEGNEAQLTLTWQDSVQFSMRHMGRELLMVFDKEFIPAGLDAAIQGLGAYLEDVRYGYDSLLLTGRQEDTSFRVSQSGAVVTIAMTMPPQSGEGLQQRKVEEDRLRFLKAKTMVSRRSLYGARARMKGLAEESPKNVEFLAELGTVEDRVGRWREAVALYDQGLSHASGEPNIIFAKALLHQQHGANLQLSGFDKWSSKDHERQDGQDVEVNLVGSRAMNLDIKLRRIDLAVDNVTDARGTTGNRDVEWMAGSAEMAWSWPDADTTRLGILAGQDTLGVTASHEWFQPASKVRVVGDWRRPYAGTTNGMVDQGWRDRLELQREDTWWGDRWHTVAGGAVNRYGNEIDTGAAQSITMTGSVRYTLLSRINMELSYVLDKEKPWHQEHRINDDGILYTLFPITPKENHLLSVAGFDLWSDYWAYNWLVGYAYDRLADQYGPMLSFSLSYEPMADIKSALSLQSGTSRQAGVWVTTNQLDYSLKILF
ncbi:MAG: hypothetical protein HQL77_13530 [Magnetococcales bacterium]|nr:hypothetical protein [Magnetococcales bacterium]